MATSFLYTNKGKIFCNICWIHKQYLKLKYVKITHIHTLHFLRIMKQAASAGIHYASLVMILDCAFLNLLESHSELVLNVQGHLYFDVNPKSVCVWFLWRIYSMPDAACCSHLAVKEISTVFSELWQPWHLYTWLVWNKPLIWLCCFTWHLPTVLGEDSPTEIMHWGFKLL